MILDDHFYCGARATHAGATSAHNNDGPPDIIGPLLIAPIVAMGDMTSNDRSTVGPMAYTRLLLAHTAVMGCLTSACHC
jgi:hypothetical protein